MVKNKNGNNPVRIKNMDNPAKIARNKELQRKSDYIERLSLELSEVQKSYLKTVKETRESVKKYIESGYIKIDTVGGQTVLSNFKGDKFIAKIEPVTEFAFGYGESDYGNASVLDSTKDDQNNIISASSGSFAILGTSFTKNEATLKAGLEKLTTYSEYFEKIRRALESHFKVDE